MRKNLIRGIVAITVLVLAFILCEKILMLKSEDGVEQMKSFYLQEDDTIDVLLIGSSHIYCNVNTGLLWDEYGMSAFDLGGAEQPYWNSYYFIKEALKTQRPKVIVMNATIPGIRFDEYQSEIWLTTNLYGMHWNKNRIDNTRVSAIKDSFWRIMFPMNTMHGRYNDLKKDDFIDKNYDVSYKGFDYRATVTPYETPDISGVTECEPIIEKQEEYLRKIIQLTKEENIPLLLVSVPFVVTEDAQKYYNYEFQIAEEEGIDYIDFNKLYNEVGINFAEDMAEELHLNISGSQKFTRYLGNYIKAKYDVPDHRGDVKYASWERDALVHRLEIVGEGVRSSELIDQYLMYANNDNYIVFVNTGSNEGVDLSAVSGSFNSIGIPTESLSKESSYIINGSNILFYSDANEFKTYLDEGNDRLVFEKKAQEDGTGVVTVSIDTDDYAMSLPGIAILVYDRVLNELVDYNICDPISGGLIK